MEDRGTPREFCLGEYNEVNKIERGRAGGEIKKGQDIGVSQTMSHSTAGSFWDDVEFGY
jgi:hypothetical protein